jgi:hypothetical protein
MHNKMYSKRMLGIVSGVMALVMLLSACSLGNMLPPNMPVASTTNTPTIENSVPSDTATTAVETTTPAVAGTKTPFPPASKTPDENKPQTEKPEELSAIAESIKDLSLAKYAIVVLYNKMGEPTYNGPFAEARFENNPLSEYADLVVTKTDGTVATLEYKTACYFTVEKGTFYVYTFLCRYVDAPYKVINNLKMPMSRIFVFKNGTLAKDTLYWEKPDKLADMKVTEGASTLCYFTFNVGNANYTCY